MTMSTTRTAGSSEDTWPSSQVRCALPGNSEASLSNAMPTSLLPTATEYQRRPRNSGKALHHRSRQLDSKQADNS